MPKKSVRQSKIYVKKSKVMNYSLGVFAKEDIESGSIIGKFNGFVGDSSKNYDKFFPIIAFEDETTFYCSYNDILCNLQDPIDFPKEKRKLVETLEKDEPFYKLFPGTRINSGIKTYERYKKDVFLVAIEDIKKDEEIYCHFGFWRWFENEKDNFEIEASIEYQIPKDIVTYPAFKRYITTIYPNGKDFVVCLNGETYCIMIPCSKQFSTGMFVPRITVGTIMTIPFIGN